MYGPDNNLPLDLGKTIELRIPRYAQVVFQFSSDAHWENAICLYNEHHAKIYEAGNYGRKLDPFTIPRDRTRERVVYVTGWHKNSPPNGGKPWHQSSVRHFQNSGDNFGSGRIGFEDAADNDYNDMETSYKFE